jgi:hypothetical protein
MNIQIRVIGPSERISNFAVAPATSALRNADVGLNWNRNNGQETEIIKH